MSTGLTMFQRNEFAAIAENSSVREAMQENLQPGDVFSELDLIVVKNPTAGSLYWQVGDEPPTPEIEGVLVFNCRQGLIWPTKEQGSGSKPLVRSKDLIYGELAMTPEEIQEGLAKGIIQQEMLDTLAKHEVLGRPGVYNWGDLPYTQFGTGNGGHGKYAKEQRLMFVLRKGDAWPLIVRTGPASAGEMSKLVKRLPVPQYRAVIGLTLTLQKSRGGQEYSRVTGKYKGVLDAESGALMKEQYTDRLRASHEAGRVFDEGTDAEE